MCVMTCYRQFIPDVTVWCDHLDPKVVKAVDNYWKSIAIIASHPVKDGIIGRLDKEGRAISTSNPAFVALVKACEAQRIKSPVQQKGETEKRFTERKRSYCEAVRELIISYNRDARARLDRDKQLTERSFAAQARDAATAIRELYEELDVNFQAQAEYLRNAPGPR